MKNKLLDINDLQDLGIGSRSTVLRRVQRRELPEPIKFGNSHNSKYFWHEDDIHAYQKKAIQGFKEDENGSL